LKLIILTRGYSDHADNCAYIREKYGAKTAMHTNDSGMVEHGDMTWNRKAKPDKVSIMFRIMQIFGRLSKQGNFNTFKPDIYIEDGQDLSEYLTTKGDLFCGDLLYNIAGFNFIDDLADFHASINKLKSLKINTVYPGHGKPFPMSSLSK
jgi:hydroxyacylglutathione hydrolase